MMEWGALLGKTMGEILQHMQRIEQRINFIQQEMNRREDETKPAPLTDQ
jgi:cytochrome c